jgi:hypothetical protein
MPIAARSGSDLQESACRAGRRTTDQTPSVALSTGPRTRAERQPRPRRSSYPCTTAHRDRKSPRQSPHAPTRPSDRGDETGSAAPYAPATTPSQPSRPSGTPVPAPDPTPPARPAARPRRKVVVLLLTISSDSRPKEERIASSPGPRLHSETARHAKPRVRARARHGRSPFRPRPARGARCPVRRPGARDVVRRRLLLGYDSAAGLCGRTLRSSVPSPPSTAPRRLDGLPLARPGRGVARTDGMP